MDIAAAPPRLRVDTRYRRWTPSFQSRERPRGIAHRKEVEGRLRGASDAPTDKEKERQQRAMTQDHRLYHRRQAPAATKTIAVEVIATVDSNGVVVGQETKTHADSVAPTLGAVVSPPPALPAAPAVVNAVPSPPAAPAALPVPSDVVPAPVSPAVPPAVPIPAVPTLPQVPAMPTAALPVVPAVPPFPSNLNVPAYPFASGVSLSSTPLVPSPAPTSSTGSSAIPASSSSVPVLGFNSTIISTSSFSSTASRASGSSAFSSRSEFDSISVHALTHSSSHSQTPSSQFSSVATSTSAVGTTFYGGMGGGGPASTAADPALATAGAGSSSAGNTPPLQTPQVVGSVVGSLAGAAIILALILFLLQRHKRQRRGALQLTNDETTDRSPPAMAQDPSKAYRIPSAFLNRFSGMSKSTVDTSSSAGERSFQRVSGRKLPSAFSEGMTSDQFSRGAALSGSSFYTDDQGTYGGPGLSKEFSKDTSATPIATGMMNIRPGPARTPVIRHPDEDNANPFDDPAPFPKGGSHLSPPQSPNPDVPRNTLGRSLQSHDGSRSSKFTENV